MLKTCWLHVQIFFNIFLRKVIPDLFDVFRRLSWVGNFRSLLLVNCSQPLYFSTRAKEIANEASLLRFSRSLTPTLSSLPFCTGIHDRIKILENRGLRTVYNACTPLKCNDHPNDYAKQRTDEQHNEWTRWIERPHEYQTNNRRVHAWRGIMGTQGKISRKQGSKMYVCLHIPVPSFIFEKKLLL